MTPSQGRLSFSSAIAALFCTIAVTLTPAHAETSKFASVCVLSLTHQVDVAIFHSYAKLVNEKSSAPHRTYGTGKSEWRSDDGKIPMADPTHYWVHQFPNLKTLAEFNASTLIGFKKWIKKEQLGFCYDATIVGGNFSSNTVRVGGINNWFSYPGKLDSGLAFRFLASKISAENTDAGVVPVLLRTNDPSQTPGLSLVTIYEYENSEAQKTSSTAQRATKAFMDATDRVTPFNRAFGRMAVTRID